MFSPEQRADVRFDALSKRASISRVIERAWQGRYFDGAEGEILQESARRAGKPFDQSRPTIPWEMLSRADSVGAAATGGFLVSDSKVLPAADALRPAVVVLQLGAQVAEVSTANYSLPPDRQSDGDLAEHRVDGRDRERSDLRQRRAESAHGRQLHGSQQASAAAV
jgi:hypothetical protein